MAIHWDGDSSIKYYASRTPTGTTLAPLQEVLTLKENIPTDSMQLVLQIVEGANAAAAQSMSVNYIRGAWTI